LYDQQIKQIKEDQHQQIFENFFDEISSTNGNPFETTNSLNPSNSGVLIFLSSYSIGELLKLLNNKIEPVPSG